ncbi:MAG: ribosome biogenesis GTPase Der [Alphaproteobacteria bacterium]|nr:ribosome biogenesis GTPase Der [Alphaproteobacteria bacterium]
MGFTVAIVGRPNVGKSTLFNRLVGRRAAIVDPTPGVTRDWREAEGHIGPLRFKVIDTAGLEEAEPDTLTGRMQHQTSRALARSDVVLFVVDGLSGLTPLDRHFARALRRQPVPIVLVVNKAEGRRGASGAYEAHELGIGEPLTISAEHGLGLDALYDVLAPYETEAEEAAPAVAEGPLDIVVIGRPNVGKSTLVNRLLGEDRMLTGPEPGVTRDAIATIGTFAGRAIRLVDTAGMRRRARVRDRLEQLSVHVGREALMLANVAVLVVDALQPLDNQELVLAGLVEEEGRALVLAINKWDLVPDRALTLRGIRDTLERSLQQLKGVRVVTLSALTGRGVEKLLPTVIEAYEVWNRKISTPKLNRWLATQVEEHAPPAAGTGRIKLRYMVQTKGRPPTFILFGSRVDALPESYRRFLVNRLRRDFELPGTPIRMTFRKSRNPYADAPA